MNVIFHLVSLGVLLALLAQIAKQRQQLAFARKFIAAGAVSDTAVWHVDWLHRFLNSLSYALSLETLSKDALGALAKQPIKSDLRLWNALHAQCQIASLQSESPSGQLCLVLAVHRDEEKARAFGTQIQAVLPKGLSIKITQAAPVPDPAAATSVEASAVATVKKGMS